MLRRTQSLADTIESATQDPPPAEVERPAPPQADRRDPNASFVGRDRRVADTDRRSQHELRAEVQRTIVRNADRKPAGSLRPQRFRRINHKLSRVLLVLVALAAGGTAAFLATQHEPSATVAPQTVLEKIVVPEARTQILVAKKAIGMGERLSPASVEWQDWPQGAIRPEYITIAATPNAVPEMTGAVARYEMFPGEPIREQKLARATQGYLSAVLSPGMRGVSVSVNADSASGGFVVPNDHVDVVLTHPTAQGQSSDTILHNVRVLAINTRLGETGTTGAPTDPANQKAEVFLDHAIATLELDSRQADVIINAASTGKLALVVRAMTDAGEIAKTEERATNEAIRMTSPFWVK